MSGQLPDRRSTIITIGLIGILLMLVVVPTVTIEGQQTELDTDNTVTRIVVDENGSAQWTIQIRTRLDSQDRVSEYEAFQSRFADNKSRFLSEFRMRMQRVVGNAANATDREMRAVEFSASTSIQEVPRRWGIVTYQFTWTNFATRTPDGLVVGDVFQGGFFLAANDTLAILPPESYDIERVSPTPDERDETVVSWRGREDFPDQRPRVEFVSRSEAGTITNSPQRTPVDSLSLQPLGFGPVVWIGIAILVILVSTLAYGGYRMYSGRTTHEAIPKKDEDQATTEPSVVMTDEERVRYILEDHGGRVKQSVVAEELEWSASKTSRVVGRMVDDGTIEKLQLGRENLLDLVDEEE